MTLNVLIPVALAYMLLLFAVASFAERRVLALRSRGHEPRLLRSSLVYTLSLSVYCTAWTFYGAVGYAARSGLEFVTIYLGPTLVFVGWWWLLLKLVRIGKAQRVTSIADLISARYGKSTALGVVVTLIAVAATTPYIALQLQSIALSFETFARDQPLAPRQLALWVAIGLAFFTILYGTRNLNSNEQHHGIVTAIAVEAVVKLVALLAVGIWVVWWLADGPADMLARIAAADRPEWQIVPGRWAGLIVLAGIAVITLPRMFQVLVVENSDERHLHTAAWAFPLYLLAMSLFVLPIAVAGIEHMPAGMNPDLYVLTLPHMLGQNALALLAFLGGLSAATSMVIIASIALSTMVSNQIIVPLWLARRRRAGSERDHGDMRGLVLNTRRIAIGAILALGYFYFAVSGGSRALAAIGLIAFLGMAQVTPALIGALFWRGATRAGAMAGTTLGACVWIYTLFLPSFGDDVVFSTRLMAEGPLGLSWLRPQALFMVEIADPLLHALFWSLFLNAAVFVIVSLVTFPSPLERVQSAQFVNALDPGDPSDPDLARARGWWREASETEAEDLLDMSRRLLGNEDALRFFSKEAREQGRSDFLPDPTPMFLDRLERELAGSVGSATAHAMIEQIVGGRMVTVDDLMAVASETAQIMEHSAQLEAKSEELARTAGQLREANEMLRKLSVQKDSFLSQISHELRTPMTSIRAFSEILMDPGLDDATRVRFASIIQDESIRLTRLLDDLLDLSVLENGRVKLDVAPARLDELIDKALMAAGSTRPERVFAIQRHREDEEIGLLTDAGRLTQVFINIISNSRKYCDAVSPELRIEAKKRAKRVTVDFIDNGTGIPKKSQSLIFEKFARLTDTHKAGGAGLGLAICREIMTNLGGDITYLPGQGGAAFRVTFPLFMAQQPADPAPVEPVPAEPAMSRAKAATG